MISFVWDDQNPMYSGRGGMENFTAGHIRELTLMGIESRVITVGLGDENGKAFFPDIEFLDIDSVEQLSDLSDTIVFINVPHDIKTRKRSFVLFHCPPRDPPHLRAEYKEAIVDKTVMVASKFMRGLWSRYLGLSENAISIVYPFANPQFGEVYRPPKLSEKTEVIFAGRLMPEKGVYLYLEAIHHDLLREGFNFTITNAGNQTEHGEILEKLLDVHPYVNVVPARHTPKEMAELLVNYEILVMPSTPYYWHEGFGMLSVEAQHAGCSVIGSNDGGLPESNCGGLTLFEPGNPLALAETICEVSQRKPVTAQERAERSNYFTRRQSVESLLKVIGS